RPDPRQGGGGSAGDARVHAPRRGSAPRERAALGGGETRAQPTSAGPRRPSRGPGLRGRRPGAEARAAARDGPRVLDQAPHEPLDDRRERRDERRRRGTRAAARSSERAASGARRASGAARPAPDRSPRLGARRRQTGGQSHPEAEGEKVAMGQKTHPIGFRIGVTRTWSSRWFATKAYTNLLHEDVKIRRFIKDQLYHAGISKIDIERSANRARITISTARPGIIIGRK